jgi:hypothetical protein
LANTPLQTIEINMALLSARVAGAEPYVERARRALERLHAWTELLNRETSAGFAGGGASFDAQEILESGRSPRSYGARTKEQGREAH